jgi:hypothetical protein
MVRVTIVVADTGEMVGEFDFDQMLRNDDYVTIAWPEDDDGLRIFRRSRGHPCGCRSP